MRRQLLKEPEEVEAFNDRKFQQHLFAAAACTNCMSLVQTLIERGYDPDASDWMLGSPIRAAALQGHTSILELLLSNPVDPSMRQKRLVLQYAAIGGHEETLELALDPRWGSTRLSEYDWSRILHSAVSSGKPRILERVKSAAGQSHSLFSQMDISHMFDEAVRLGHLDMVRCLLHNGAVPNSQWDGMTALQVACRLGHMHIVELLLERGADPNFGFIPPLCHAADGGHLQIARTLIAHGSDINGGWPPAIARAIELEHTALFHLLRGRGAIIHTQEIGGFALNVAVGQGLESMVALLLQNGVKPEGGSGGDPPLKVAMDAGYHGIVQILLKYGAAPVNI